MEPITFRGTEEPATLTDIEAVEREYGFTLPSDYKAHILTYNGGWPTNRSTFLQPDPDEPGRFIPRSLSDFYSVAHGEETLESSLESLYSELHDDLVPFASETGGDIFVLSVGPKDYGSVYYIGHEFYVPPFEDQEYDEEDDTAVPLAPLQYGKGVHFLAPSFTAFLEGLVASQPLA